MTKRYTIFDGDGKVVTNVDFDEAFRVLRNRCDGGEPIDSDRAAIKILKSASSLGAVKTDGFNVVACASSQRGQR
jgi:hypothetical protein